MDASQTQSQIVNIQEPDNSNIYSKGIYSPLSPNITSPVAGVTAHLLQQSEIVNIESTHNLRNVIKKHKRFGSHQDISGDHLVAKPHFENKTPNQSMLNSTNSVNLKQSLYQSVKDIQQQHQKGTHTNTNTHNMISSYVGNTEFYSHESSSNSNENEGNNNDSLEQPSIENEQMHDDSLSSDDSENKKKKQMHFQDDSQSVRTGQSQFFSQKQNIFSFIISKRDSPQIYYSRISGYVAYTLLIFITSLLFFSVKSNYDTLWMNYSNLTIGPAMSQGFTQVLHMKEFLTVLQVNQLYGYLFSSFSASELVNFQLEATVKFDSLKQNIGSLQRYHVKEGFEDLLINNKIAVQLSNEVNVTDIYYRSFTKMYTIEQCLINIITYIQKGDSISRTFVYINYRALFQTMTEITTISIENALTKLDETNQLLLYSILFIELITVASIILIFPIYYVVQAKKQEIMSLLVTFDSFSLRQMIEKHRTALWSLEILSKSHEKGSHHGSNSQNRRFTAIHPTNLQSDQQLQQQSSNFQSSTLGATGNKKKKTISQTNQIPKFSPFIAAAALLSFILISLYSLMNYLFTENFFSLFHFHIEELSLVQETIRQVSFNYAGLMLTINSYAYKFNDDSNDLLLSLYYNETKPTNQNTIDSFYNINSHFSDNRFQSDQYTDNFILPIQKNACNILSTSSFAAPVLKENAAFVEMKNCSSISSGILTKGIAVTLKDFIEKQDMVYSNYVLTRKNALGFFYTLKKWDKDSTLRQMEEMYFYLRTIIGVISAFLIDQSDQYFTYLNNLSLILFLYSLIIISFIFWVAWRKFLQKMTTQIQRTMLLLSIMPIEFLLDNPYILSYIHKQKRMNKKKE